MNNIKNIAYLTIILLHGVFFVSATPALAQTNPFETITNSRFLSPFASSNETEEDRRNERANDSGRDGDTQNSIDRDEGSTDVKNEISAPPTRLADIYDIIESALNTQNDEEDKDAATTTPPTSQEDDSDSDPTPVGGGVIRPQENTPIEGSRNSTVLIQEKRSKIHAMTEALVPTDQYVESGFTPVTTYSLYIVSLLLASSGLLLIIRKPELMASKVESIFNFE